MDFKLGEPAFKNNSITGFIPNIVLGFFNLPIESLTDSFIFGTPSA